MDFEQNINSYWIVAAPNQQPIHIDQKSTLKSYSLSIYQDCPLHDEPCCQVTSRLDIKDISVSQNGATVTCYAEVQSQIQSETTSSSAYLSKWSICEVSYMVMILSMQYMCVHIQHDCQNECNAWFTNFNTYI